MEVRMTKPPRPTLTAPGSVGGRRLDRSHRRAFLPRQRRPAIPARQSLRRVEYACERDSRRSCATERRSALSAEDVKPRMLTGRNLVPWTWEIHSKIINHAAWTR